MEKEIFIIQDIKYYVFKTLINDYLLEQIIKHRKSIMQNDFNEYNVIQLSKELVFRGRL